MIIAFKTHYYKGNSYTVGGVFQSWSSEDVYYYAVSKKPCEGEGHNVSSIMHCLKLVNIDSIDTIIIDGYVWQGDNEKGLGARIHEAIKRIYGVERTVIGISDTKPNKEIPNCVEVRHGLDSRDRPLYVTCSDVECTNHYSVLVNRMNGNDRVPTVLDNITDKVVNIILDSPSNEIGLDMSDLDEWAENAFSTSNTQEALDKWIEETEKNGFKYK